MERLLYYYVVFGFLQIGVCVFGILGNIISAVVLTQPEMKSSVNVLLLGLALADIMYLLSRVFFNGLVVCFQFYDLADQYENSYEPFIDTAVLICLRFGEFGRFILLPKSGTR